MNNFDKGNTFYNSKDYINAIKYYKLAIENRENLACSYYNAGVSYIKLKDYNTALGMIRNAISLQKESKYYFNLAYCYAMQENTNKALIYFNMAWAMDENDKECEKAIRLIVNKKSS